ncbi:hypothetical protein GCM10022236_50390 [Microlunatus ginsengisoli]|uniref:Xaa-Pro dipeptidyl-peptidase C-terminal domain-containing protein n=1 Tax=Microlunatus ginsengisoli TaxID=363863 RepID=A0ABP7AVP0_9ACTN
MAISAHDNFRVMYPGGAFALEGTLTLLDGLDHLEDGFVRGLARFPTAARRLRRAYQELPLVRAQDTMLAGNSMPYTRWLHATTADDPVWRDQRLLAALERVDVPVLLHEGWQDRFVDQTLDQYARLRARGVEVALTIGPWNHVQVATKAAPVTMRETLDWLAVHLAGDADRVGASERSARVRIFVTGAERWRELPDWPPPARARSFYLQPGGGLAEQEPNQAAEPSRFSFDPADPTPAVGGRVINPSIAGPRDNRELERRSDVLVFTTSVLTEPLEIVGSPVAEIVHTSDNPYADLFVRLCEVRANGTSLNLADGFCRLPVENLDPTVRLPLDALAHRLAAGSRLRLQVSGGAHPRYARNLGTGDDPATATDLVPSRRTLHHGAGGASRIILPCHQPGHDVTPEVTPQG